MGGARLKPELLSQETRIALLILKRTLAAEAERLGFAHAQVTFDNLQCSDSPPTIDVLGLSDAL